jgi:hypothetical protein
VAINFVRYVVKNSGPGAAYVTRQNQAFVFTDEYPLPDAPPESPTDTPIKGIIDGNSEIEADARSILLSSEKVELIRKERLAMFWTALIEYRDERGKLHRYRAPAGYVPSTGRWVYPRNIPDTWHESS